MFYYKDLEFETEGVYEPAEDSLLLARVIEGLDLKGKTLLDIGCGCGIQGIIAANRGANVLCIDINSAAITLAKKNAKRNKVKIDAGVSNLFEEVEERFDFIVFNSPYIPVDENLPQSEIWAGGENLEVIEMFLKDAKNYLKEDGIIFLLISSATGLERITSMSKDMGYTIKIADREKIPWETLYVLEIKHS